MVREHTASSRIGSTIEKPFPAHAEFAGSHLTAPSTWRALPRLRQQARASSRVGMMMTIPARARYGGYRFPAEIIGHAVWLYFRFPLGLRMVEELLAERGIIVSHETVRQWARRHRHGKSLG